jgi:hypothetical protein
VPVVAALMGHSRAYTALDTYSHEFNQHRLGTAVVMVDAITAARAIVGRPVTAPPRLRQPAP